ISVALGRRETTRTGVFEIFWGLMGSEFISSSGLRIPSIPKKSNESQSDDYRFPAAFRLGQARDTVLEVVSFRALRYADQADRRQLRFFAKLRHEFNLLVRLLFQLVAKRLLFCHAKLLKLS